MNTNIIKFESERIKLCCKCQSYELKQDKDTDLFTTYSILIISPYRTWSIKKRYSDFESLSNLLKHKYPKLPTPSLPPKRWQKNSKETSDERLQQFEIYLSSIFSTIPILLYEEIVSFIDFGVDLINIYFLHLQFMSNNDPIIYNESLYHLDLLGTNSYYDLLKKFRLKEFDYSKTIWMFLIEEFLRNLIEKNSSQSDIITLFKAFIWENNANSSSGIPCLKRGEIKTLFIGFEDGIGLLTYVGFYRENPFGSEACLIMINELLSCEFNKMSEEFAVVLKDINCEFIQKMYLDYMIMSKKNSIKMAVFNFLMVIGYDDTNIKKALNNENAIKDYLDWKNKNGA